MLEVALAVAAALVAFAATLSALERWLAGRRRYEAAWAVAFGMFAIASAALAAGAGLGWDGSTFRVFYLFGAILNVPVLALGTLMLLASTSVQRVAQRVVALFAALSTGVMMAVPFTDALPADRLVRGSEVLPALPRLLAAAASSIGTLVVAGGAIRSALRIGRSPGGRRRATGNVLIATGALVTGASGLANSVLGEMVAFALFLAVGVTVIFVGYLVAATAKSGEGAALPLGDSSRSAAPPRAHNQAPAG